MNIAVISAIKSIYTQAMFQKVHGNDQYTQKIIEQFAVPQFSIFQCELNYIAVK